MANGVAKMPPINSRKSKTFQPSRMYALLPVANPTAMTLIKNSTKYSAVNKNPDAYLQVVSQKPRQNNGQSSERSRVEQECNETANSSDGVTRGIENNQQTLTGEG